VDHGRCSSQPNRGPDWLRLWVPTTLISRYVPGVSGVPISHFSCQFNCQASLPFMIQGPTRLDSPLPLRGGTIQKAPIHTITSLRLRRTEFVSNPIIDCPSFLSYRSPPGLLLGRGHGPACFSSSAVRLCCPPRHFRCLRRTPTRFATIAGQSIPPSCHGPHCRTCPTGTDMPCCSAPSFILPRTDTSQLQLRHNLCHFKYAIPSSNYSLSRTKAKICTYSHLLMI
jgi:hypothetical protein